jgi:hypothetical protein
MAAAYFEEEFRSLQDAGEYPVEISAELRALEALERGKHTPV